MHVYNVSPKAENNTSVYMTVYTESIILYETLMYLYISLSTNTHVYTKDTSDITVIFYCFHHHHCTQYCHYVAGLVGIGLSRLFSASELESAEVGQDHALANSMGLFLQKTNIIRDYLEDILQGREFWPKEVRLNSLSII